MTDLRKWAGFGFLMLNVALGVLIGAEIYAWHQTSHPDQTATAVVRLDHETAARPPQPQDQHRQWFNTILARPLFSPDRRPIEVGRKRIAAPDRSDDFRVSTGGDFCGCFR